MNDNMQYVVTFDISNKERLSYLVNVKNSNVFNESEKPGKSDEIRIVNLVVDLFPTSRINNIIINKVLTSTIGVDGIEFNRIKEN